MAAATLIAANAWSAGGVHPAAGNPHPAAGNPHPAAGNPHPAASLPTVAAVSRSGNSAISAPGRQNGRIENLPEAASPAEPETRISLHYVGNCGAPPQASCGTVPVITGFAPNPVQGFAPNPVKGFVTPSPTPNRWNWSGHHWRHPPTGFAGGLEPFPSWPGFTPSVPGPMADDVRELIADENGIRVFRHRTIPVVNDTAAAAESDLVTKPTLNTAAPQSGF